MAKAATKPKHVLPKQADSLLAGKSAPKSTGKKPAAKKQPPRPATPATEPDLKAAFELVMQLMAIPGGSGDEAAVAEFIRTQLIIAGVPRSAIKFDNAHTKTPLNGKVGNLIVQLPGTMAKPRRLLMAHMDTVPICIGAKPVRKGNFVSSSDPATGLGADDRAGVAVILSTLLHLVKHKLPSPPLTFLWTIQEEVGLHGARNVQTSMLGRPKLAFNWDGGPDGKLTIGATGGYRMQIEITGLASHAGGAPEQGISAIAIASLAIADLVSDGWHGDIRKGESRGTSNVGFIQGGQATNVVTDRVEIKAEARSHDPQFRQQIVARIQQAFTDAAQAVRNTAGVCGQVKFNGRLDYESFKLADGESCVLAAEAAIETGGLEPLRAISNGGLDANWMSARGIPTVTLGCGQMQIHTASEQLDIEAFENACRIALRLATASERPVE